MDKTKLKLVGFLLSIVIVLLVVASSGKGGIVSNQIGFKMIGTPIVNNASFLEEKKINNKNEDIIIEKNEIIDNTALSYSDFISIYSQKRIQFNDSCQAVPTTVSFSVGDTIVLDNRSNQLQAVKFIDDLYALPPLHVRVFKLTKQGIFDIDCGTSKNVAKITVH